MDCCSKMQKVFSSTRRRTQVLREGEKTSKKAKKYYINTLLFHITIKTDVFLVICQLKHTCFLFCFFVCAYCKQLIILPYGFSPRNTP